MLTPSLKDRFDFAWHTLGLDTTHREYAWHQIERNYNLKRRKYHNFVHLEAMFTAIDTWLAKPGRVVVDLKIKADLYLAIFFHDFHYTPGRRDNEFLSGLAAEKMLVDAGMVPAQAEHIFNLIMLTRKHNLIYAEDQDYQVAQLLIDADLFGFVTDFKVNTDNIILEAIQSNFRIKTIHANRKAFLEKFVLRKPFFYTPEIEAGYGDIARANIQSELDNYGKRSTL